MSGLETSESERPREPGVVFPTGEPVNLDDQLSSGGETRETAVQFEDELDNLESRLRESLATNRNELEVTMAYDEALEGVRHLRRKYGETLRYEKILAGYLRTFELDSLENKFGKNPGRLLEEGERRLLDLIMKMDGKIPRTAADFDLSTERMALESRIIGWRRDVEVGIGKRKRKNRWKTPEGDN